MRPNTHILESNVNNTDSNKNHNIPQIQTVVLLAIALFLLPFAFKTVLRCNNKVAEVAEVKVVLPTCYVEQADGSQVPYYADDYEGSRDAAIAACKEAAVAEGELTEATHL